MALGTGTVSMSDIRTEWGRSGTIKLSEMYRGGAYVRAKAGNNTGTNLAASVPTSGTIKIDNFRGTAKGFRFTFSSTATNQNASTLFGDDYAVDYPKEILINSGVELGATSTSEEALQVDSGGSGTITVTNNGTLTGAGGAAGAAGGDAFEADVACTFVNNGTIRSGGGGGGAGGTGGTGGGGQYTSTGSLVTFYTYSCNTCASVNCNSAPGAGSYINISEQQFTVNKECQGCRCKGQQQTTTNTNGGAGGSGGAATVGQGYNQSAGASNSGSGGASGGTNAGTGGSGGASGAGGAFGTAGSSGATGSTGANGNRTNGVAGSAGSSGGAAGAAIRGISSVTLTNNGTITGGQV